MRIDDGNDLLLHRRVHSAVSSGCTGAEMPSHVIWLAAEVEIGPIISRPMSIPYELFDDHTAPLKLTKLTKLQELVCSSRRHLGLHNSSIG